VDQLKSVFAARPRKDGGSGIATRGEAAYWIDTPWIKARLGAKNP